MNCRISQYSDMFSCTFSSFCTSTIRMMNGLKMHLIMIDSTRTFAANNNNDNLKKS